MEIVKFLKNVLFVLQDTMSYHANVEMNYLATEKLPHYQTVQCCVTEEPIRLVSFPEGEQPTSEQKKPRGRNPDEN